MTSPILTYRHNLDQVQKLVSRMYADLEKYAEKPESSETYISIQNEIIKTIASFVNSSEAVIQEACSLWIDRDTFNEIIAGYERKLILEDLRRDNEVLMILNAKLKRA